ncbi:hypothetical protein SNS2_1532 [Streptomyces netropsis]|nr:hypothetical protein SNS2_1532 [Streptomyces netropsis]
MAFTARDHALGVGPMPPETARQHGAYRGYVRQEYLLWRRYGNGLWHCTCDDLAEGPCPAHPNPDF